MGYPRHFVIEVPLPSQESELSLFVCEGIDFDSFHDFDIDFGIE